MTKARAERAKALEQWAERVESSDLKEADTEALRTIAELAERRDDVESELTEAVRSARQAHRTWSEIGAMLGVSKQAAQRKYGSNVSA
jgi:predicted ATP-dependent protease